MDDQTGRPLRRNRQLRTALRHRPACHAEPRLSLLETHRIDWDDGKDSGTEFHLTISSWMRLFCDVGFAIVDHHELRSPTTGDDIRFYVTADWAHDYPAEQAWRLRKPA